MDVRKLGHVLKDPSENSVRFGRQDVLDAPGPAPRLSAVSRGRGRRPASHRRDGGEGPRAADKVHVSRPLSDACAGICRLLRLMPVGPGRAFVRRTGGGRGAMNNGAAYEGTRNAAVLLVAIALSVGATACTSDDDGHAASPAASGVIVVNRAVCTFLTVDEVSQAVGRPVDRAVPHPEAKGLCSYPAQGSTSNSGGIDLAVRPLVPGAPGEAVVPERGGMVDGVGDRARFDATTNTFVFEKAGVTVSVALSTALNLSAEHCLRAATELAKLVEGRL
ncbi:hypothetical protein OG216_47160 (plasmid) [Streptomycetaceae bacterium NBC_01309]